MAKKKSVSIPVDNTEEKRAFTIFRHGDVTGVSGAGRALDGWITHNGKVVICWRTDTVESESQHGHSSLGIFDSFKAFKLIHIDSHPENDTEIIWYDLKKSKEQK